MRVPDTAPCIPFTRVAMKCSKVGICFTLKKKKPPDDIAIVEPLRTY